MYHGKPRCYFVVTVVRPITTVVYRGISIEYHTICMKYHDTTIVDNHIPCYTTECYHGIETFTMMVLKLTMSHHGRHKQIIIPRTYHGMIINIYYGK